MSLKPVTFQGAENFKANLYALEVRSRFVDQGKADGYYAGYGNELSATVASNTIKIGSGAFVVQGRMCEVENSESVSVVIENGKYGYYELGENTPAEPKNVEISSYIKTVENDIAYVVYRINGTDVATAYAIPFTVNIDFSKYSNQTVSISALAFNADGVPRAQKTYNIKVK